MSDWMPIETAPKDGSVILVWPVRAYPANHEGVFDAPGAATWCAHLGEPGWREATGEMYSEYEPTHWMPLPKPPTDLASAVKAAFAAPGDYPSPPGRKG